MYSKKIVELDTIVLLKELPEHDLNPGDIGCVLHADVPDYFIVEFNTAEGYSRAIIELHLNDILKLRPSPVTEPVTV